MGKTIYILSSLLASSLLLYGIAELSSREPGFRDRLVKYIEENQPPPLADRFRSSPVVIIDPPAGSGGQVLDYEKGDWERFITGTRYDSIDSKRGISLYEDEKMNITSYGSLKADMTYGDSVFTKKKYRRSDTDQASSKVVSPGFTPKQEIQLHLEGTVGRRMSIYIDHDSRREDNRYRMNYRAVNDDEMIREINAGEVDISFKNSKYAVYDNSTAKGLGVDVTVKKDNFQIKAFGSVTRGEAVVENFRGTASPGSTKLSDYQYIRRMYYQVEPYRRYDGITSPPSGAGAYSLNTFESNSSDFVPYTVDIDPSGFSIYLDDQVGSNNTGNIQLSLDQGYYAKLAEGIDYTINYAAGRIKFIKAISESSRAFVLYNLKSGSTSDPSARSDVFPGYNFVFIRYGYTLGEDLNGNFVLDGGEDKNSDGMLNSDVYEIRSVYSLGTRNIMPSKFSLQFYEENSILDTTARSQTGSYQIDYENGTVSFNYREPFRSLLGTSSADIIYSEKQLTSTYTSSRYALGADFFREARSFKLKYFNIIPGSLRVKVDNREVNKSLYTIDHTSGYLAFSDASNPLITPETAIEIRYEYIPLGGQAQSFVGGMRADYRVNKSLNVGGTLLYTRSGGTEVIPVLSQAPTDTLLMEGDAKLHLTPARMADMINLISGSSYKTIPLDFKFYGEYARSMKNMNSFGKGLIDNMESTDEIVAISLGEKDWILSSLTGGQAQSSRGKLLYYYYRNPSNPGVLQTLDFTPTALDYAVKPGPFNVAAGHVDNSINREKTQQSLALDFDFTDGNFVSIATRHLSGSSVDFSGLQYVEISWRYIGASPSDNVDLHIDLGTINEDSDGDGSLDTEDANGNGELDTDPGSGISEDSGYTFNGNNTTVEGAGTGLDVGLTGDGILSTEDLNGNGVLDISGDYLTVPGTATTPSSFSFSAVDSDWHETKIYFDPSVLSQGEQEILKQVQTIRLSLERNNVNTGRIYIDRIRFVSSRWRNPRLDGVVTGPDNMKVSVINSLNNTEYSTEAFHLNRRDIYTDLYGGKSGSELAKESESALKLEYDTTGGTSASIERSFAEKMDLRFYRTLHLWINSRSFAAGDVLGVTIGSSDTDYREYRYTLENEDTWQEVTMKLGDKSSGNLEVYSETGTLDMKRINFMKLTVYGADNSGELWINDIYVSDAETLTSDASWIEGELNVKRPLFKTKGGTPILSDIRLKYIRKGHGAQFSSIGKTIADISEQYDQLFTSFKITPKWKTSFDFVQEVSGTDSLNENVTEERRGDSNKKTFNLETAYESSINAVPSVKLGYKGEIYNNELHEGISGGDVLRSTAQVNHAPVLVLDEKIEKFLWGKLTARLILNLLFTQEKISRESEDFTEPVLSGITSVQEEEKRQKSDTNFVLEYRNSTFYLRPSVTASSEEIVAYQGKGDVNEAMISSDFSSNFHFPYVYSDDMRFIERNKKFKFDFGFHGIKYLNPVYSMEMSYLENGFRDYDDAELAKTSLFTRAKDARSHLSTKITLPVNLKSLKKVKWLYFVKSLKASYSRSMFLTETGVPFENEGEGEFSEQYGISRSMGNLANAGLNIFQFFPGFSFLGRKNYARGRDYVYNHLNSGITYEGGETAAGYNNNLKLLENMGLNWLFDFKRFTFSTGLKLSQISERQSVSGIPQQIISRDLSFKFRFDLMKLFRFGFFRPNEKKKPHHSASCDIGYAFSNSMIITSNIREDKHTPKFGLNFKWGRSHAGGSFGVDVRHRREEEYIPLGSGRNPADDIYFNNLTTVSGLNEFSTGYTFALIYETDVLWLFNVFSKLYRLASYPIMTLEYKLSLNRYDYSITTAPEAYDMHLFSGKITLDMHKNVQGALTSRLVLEQYRNRDSGSVNREIFSYEVGAQFSLIF